MNNIKNFRCFRIRYLGPTNNQPGRTKIIDFRRQNQITLDYDYEFNSSMEQAVDYLEARGINIIGKAELNKRDDICFSDNFDIMITGDKHE